MDLLQGFSQYSKHNKMQIYIGSTVVGFTSFTPCLMASLRIQLYHSCRNSPTSVSLTAWKRWNFIVQLHGLDNLRFSFWQIQECLQYPDWLWGPPSYGMKLTTHLHLILRRSLTFSRHGSVLNTEHFYIKKVLSIGLQNSKNYTSPPQI
jgi:hypothetical protein